jgi:hypothetical protein
MKTSDLILLGLLGLGAYYFFKNGGIGAGFGGGSGSDMNEVHGTNNGGGLPVGNTTVGYASQAGVAPAQSWTGVTFGQPGQPSTQFAINTLYEASHGMGGPTTLLAAQGINAGAPPRIVAKMKAGKWY